MKQIRLRKVRYSPGYSDMNGGRHSMSLVKDAGGCWTFICSDREAYDVPTVTAAYAVSDEAVAQFEKFITRNRIFSLEKRPKSSEFATDYSQWSFSFDYEKTAFEKIERDSCDFDEYKRYSRADYALINELCDRFTALRGEKISEFIEENK